MEPSQEGVRRPLFDRYFSFVESLKPSDKLLFLFVFCVFLTSSFFVLFETSEQNKQTVATDGGTLTEGIVGTPRFVNPVLAITRADQDMVALIYSGLLRLNADGELVNDIAESITISDDGLVYNIVLRKDVYFHDGSPLSSTDVAYTIGLIQDPLLKSPLRGNWNDVTLEVLGEHEVNFVLEEPYAPFIENLTVGILPKHIWGDLSIEQLPFSQHNTEPVGTGPYQLLEVDYNESGLINAYTLTASDRSGHTAKISNITLNFYQNEETLIEAFDEGEFENTSAFSYETLTHIDTARYTIAEQPLPRVFSVFFNQNKSAALRDEAVRKALNVAIDRDALIEMALNGHGVPTTSPVPPGFLQVQSTDATTTTTEIATTTPRIRQAEDILIGSGWEQQEDGSWQKDIDDVPTKLSITLTTANSEVFERTAEYLKSTWAELGVETNVAFFDQTDLVQAVIRPRDYQALLFGIDMGRSLDLYPFWHSSQKDDPGLNISLYTNITTDKLLETARTTQDEALHEESILSFEKEVATETPAIFLYSPTFTYVIQNNITTTIPERMIKPSERWSEVHTWHMEENRVWPLFTP